MIELGGAYSINSLNLEKDKNPESNSKKVAVIQGSDKKITGGSEDDKGSSEVSGGRFESSSINVTEADKSESRVIVKVDLSDNFSKALNNTSKAGSSIDLGFFGLRFNSFYQGGQVGVGFTEDQVTNFQNDVKALANMLRQHVQDNCELIKTKTGVLKHEAYIKH